MDERLTLSRNSINDSRRRPSDTLKKGYKALANVVSTFTWNFAN